MSSVNEIKQHLKAVEQTRQITNAMYLLSTSRMKKAMQHIDFNLLYLKRLRATIKDILSKTKNNNLTNRFIEDNGLGTAVFVVVTSDKGLCGGYNSSVVKLAEEEMAKYQKPMVISLGLAGDKTFREKGVKPEYSWYGASQHPTMNLASQVANKLIELYLTNDYHEVYVVYTEFVSSAVQEPRCVRLLPLLRRDFLDVESEGDKNAQMIFEPSIEVVFDQLVYQYVTGFMYDVFMQSAASENIARMTAMQNATHNADEMLKHLSTELNAARQLQITNEITEISAAAELGGV
ncbi:MAG: ATP synthase F1 subunit gamma [Clostridia bacterium]|nr:ATP synthase F1 subunit gamma [Clostridia bacterium]